MTNPVVESVRRSLGHDSQTLQSIMPAIYPARQPDALDKEIDLFIQEVQKLSGTAQRCKRQSLRAAINDLINAETILKAAVWDTPWLKTIGVGRILEELGVELVSLNADKYEIAQCDIGVTEADYLLPETGTIVLKSSNEKPRSVSLLPRIHLAIVRPNMLRADFQQVFEEAKNSNYLVLISGPSRTADIELTITLGVHGPKNLYVWMLSGEE